MHWVESLASILEEPRLAPRLNVSRRLDSDERYEEVVDRLTAVTPEVDQRINDAVERESASKPSRGRGKSHR